MATPLNGGQQVRTAGAAEFFIPFTNEETSQETKDYQY
jgi:hypothetical protein